MPERLLSQLAHVEVLTPDPEASLRFYTQVLGLEETERVGQSAYLRGWGDFFHHSLKVTEAAEPGIGHIAWRAEGPEQLERAVTRLEATGLGQGWTEGDHGHGAAYRYASPHGGQVQEVLWDVERYQPPAHLAPTFPNRPQRYVPRGAAVRSLDHVTVVSNRILDDVAWYGETLGHRFTEYTVAEDHSDFVVFAMTTTTHLSHDLGIVFDPSGVPNRVNHIAFWVDQREELLRAADVLLDADIAIEFGPGRHGMGEQDYLYVREPGGVRIELNAGGYRNWMPDWEPVRWDPSQGSNVYYRNGQLPLSMRESFPPVGHAPAEEEVRSGLFA